MLFGHAKKHPEIKNQPKNYKLGTGHITFFKDKLLYLKERHELIKEEMKNRNFKVNKTIIIKHYDKKLLNKWLPKSADAKIIKERLKEKILMKPHFYRYKRKHQTKIFLLNLINEAKLP